ncbi:MAG: hypothetical protein KDB14_15025 [Planctomycetales bacterium]|nr:hypothetical protein [Planctomycetales bacterium]
MLKPHRRDFLAAGAATALAAPPWSASEQARAQLPQAKHRPRIAALFTVLRFRSHAYNILENFLGPYYFNGQLRDPGVDIVSFYADQFPADDMAKEVARRFKIPLFSSIEQAMCVGGRSLDVDGVLLIGEHGDYPYNEIGQHLYPRKQFFDQAIAVMERAGRFVPLFNDKHLSYRWDWAKQMHDTTQQHRMPLLAGSSVPLAERRPPLELPAGAKIVEAVSVHGGGLESYDFHGIEVLQSIVESRHGGETGVARIELVHGEAYQQALREGRWSQDLVDAAMAAERSLAPSDGKPLRQQRPRGGVFQPATPNSSQERQQTPARPAGDYAICIEYLDGLRATVLKQGGGSDRWNFACRVADDPKPRATAFFNGPWGNRCLFKALSHAIQHLFIHREEPYPSERTLLTTGMTEAGVQSFAAGTPIETPHLRIAYQAREWAKFRETGESWKQLTVDTPQPTTFQPREPLAPRTLPR